MNERARIVIAAFVVTALFFAVLNLFWRLVLGGG